MNSGVQRKIATAERKITTADCDALLAAQAARIRQNLHDGAGQLVFALRLGLTDLRHDLDEATGRKVAELLSITGELDRQLGRPDEELIPEALDQGVRAALRVLVERLSRLPELTVTLDYPPMRRLPPAVETCLYRAAHEALINVVRHAHATRVSIAVECTSAALVCRVVDDGIGMDGTARGRRSHGGFGLSGMRARLEDVGGSVKIVSAPGCGTEVAIQIPLSKELAHAS